jgi:hypothetical protein
LKSGITRPSNSAVLEHVRELLAWRNGAETVRPKLTVATFDLSR